MYQKFSVRWGNTLKMVTIFVLAICVGIPVTGFNRLVTEGADTWSVIVLFIPILAALGSMFFAIRGYVITDSQIIINHIGWKRTFEIAKLTQATFEPQVTAGSIRVWGNGGLFSFSGYFRNSVLGSYRAYMTNAADAVVLRFGEDTVVISPADPVGFVEALSAPVL
jgi:hypothetical protein